MEDVIQYITTEHSKELDSGNFPTHIITNNSNLIRLHKFVNPIHHLKCNIKEYNTLYGPLEFKIDEHEPYFRLE